ncbi:MarR family transcriptional regulator [Bordetella bronchialis]|uniref:MarR family transcriptional regulator n=1 Tax=Bordetella bronchialis TaxID=463025 RepID=UPI003D05B843
MDTVSPEQIESARTAGKRMRKEIGDAIANFTQTRAADFMETSASTVNRIVANDLDAVCHLFAVLGYQLAPLDSMVVSKARIEALETMTYEYLRAKIEGRGWP